MSKFGRDVPNQRSIPTQVDAAKPVSSKHGVSSMPTFVFFKDGAELDRFSGADEAKLETLIERYK